MYKHIIFATDFSPEAEIAEKRASEAAEKNNAKLSVINVVDYYPAVQLDGGIMMAPEIGKALKDAAEEHMAKCKARLSLGLTHAHIATGAPKHAITDYAEEIGADLIVIGSHGRHGLGLLLGSTANGVLHLAKCDVLAVRVV